MVNTLTMFTRYFTKRHKKNEDVEEFSVMSGEEWMANAERENEEGARFYEKEEHPFRSH